MRTMLLKFPIIGEFSPERVRVTWVPPSRKVIPDVDALIESRWQDALKRPGIHLFDGPMGRLESAQVSDGVLHLQLSQTSYRIFVGTNLSGTAPALAARHGREILANPIGLSSLLLSSDGHAVMGRRNAKVAYYPLRVHPFAGCLEPGDAVDVFNEIRRELREELGFEDADIADITCTGLAEDQSLFQPELIFATRSKRTLAEIAARLDPEEHRGLFTAPATQAGIEAALNADEDFTPVGIAALMLWGRIQFGDDWFTSQTPR
jgi:hypothetical protein